MTMTTTTLVLGHGKHATRDDGMCLLEAVAWIAGEPHTDHPRCCCPVLAVYGRALNDWLGDEQRQRLIPLVERLVGTRSTAGVQRRRAYLFADRAIRVFAPLALDATGRPYRAATLRALDPITDAATAWASEAAAEAWARESAAVMWAQASARAAAAWAAVQASDAARAAAEAATAAEAAWERARARAREELAVIDASIQALADAIEIR